MSPETEEQFSKAKLSHVVATHSLHHAFLSLVATQSHYIQSCVGPRPQGLETRVIIKISTHPCYTHEPLTAYGIKQKKLENRRL